MVEIIRVKNEDEMKRIREIRMEVFVGEQGVPAELEMDSFDDGAIHVLAYVNGEPAGCGRLLLNGNSAKIGRVAVRKKYRGSGIGSGICKLLISIAEDNGVEKIRLNAQLTAVGFYSGLGFEKEGDVFMEAGIRHIGMFRTI